METVEGVVCGACGARVLGSGYREAFEDSFWGQRDIVSGRSEQATTFLESALCCGVPRYAPPQHFLIFCHDLIR